MVDIRMVILWLMMVNKYLVNKYLVGGAITILKNDGVRQWEGLLNYPIYEMENKSYVWNHQPDGYIILHISMDLRIPDGIYWVYLRPIHGQKLLYHSFDGNNQQSTMALVEVLQKLWLWHHANISEHHSPNHQYGNDTDLHIWLKFGVRAIINSGYMSNHFYIYSFTELKQCHLGIVTLTKHHSSDIARQQNFRSRVGPRHTI